MEPMSNMARNSPAVDWRLMVIGFSFFSSGLIPPTFGLMAGGLFDSIFFFMTLYSFWPVEKAAMRMP